jgi:hypothetical protein
MPGGGGRRLRAVTASEPDPAALIGVLASPVRLRVFAALVLGARTADEVAGRARLRLPETLRSLLSLQSAGLALREDEGWYPVLLPLQRAAAAASSAARPDDPDDPALTELTRDEAAVFRAFVRDGRIVALPAQRGRRLVLLDHVARAFEVGVRFPEREVDAVLRAFYDDHVTLRRYLVDEGFLSREAGQYWRSGGTVV